MKEESEQDDLKLTIRAAGFWFLWLAVCVYAAFLVSRILLFVYIGATMDSVSSGPPVGFIVASALLLAGVMVLGGWLGGRMASRWQFAGLPWWKASAIGIVLSLLAFAVLPWAGPASLLPLGNVLLSDLATFLVMVVSVVGGQVLARRALARDGAGD